MRFEQRNFEQGGRAQILNKLAAPRLFQVQSSQEENFLRKILHNGSASRRVGFIWELGEHLKRVEKNNNKFSLEKMDF